MPLSMPIAILDQVVLFLCWLVAHFCNISMEQSQSSTTENARIRDCKVRAYSKMNI